MKKYFITGLIILLPLAVTILVVAFIVNFLTQPFMGVVSALFSELIDINKGFLFLSKENLVRYVSQFVILAGLFVVTVLLGMIARWFFFKSLINLSDKVLHRIPLVNKVYKTSQEIIRTLFASDKNSFKQVVMVPFPKDGIYAIGLISRESPKVCSDTVKAELFSVLIPTTPNPTTGFLLMYRKQDIIFLDMKPEDAIKYIVSCGVITPPAKPMEEMS
ncbi:MAG: DUF502 domain-containing protein [Chlamydiales bacterium]|nr:DUF502 domain-containing protein [Chlamydiales bacterium]